jgi:hypothetical protein
MTERKPMGPRHKRIWLQVDEPEVSWCQDQIHDTDVEYVAISVVREAVERVRPPLEGLGVDEPCVKAVRGALDALLAELGLRRTEGERG